MGERTVRLNIKGRVQGVGFRAWTAETARALGVAGWVRNEADGSVSALAHGEVEAIETLAQAVRQGPPGAAVETVDIKGVDDTPGLSGFTVRR